jgi:signal transduction histidine kinase
MNTYRHILSKFKGFSITGTTEKLHQMELARLLKTAEIRFGDDTSDGSKIPDNIRIVTINSGSGQILGDDDELFNAVFNIVLNAVESMPYGGDITIESKIEGRMALLEIADHGSGMNEGELKRIFEPFFTTKKGIARGLGLSIAHKIAVMHGGDIDVISEPGRGSKFIIRIPLIDPEQTALYSARKKSTGGMSLSN